MEKTVFGFNQSTSLELLDIARKTLNNVVGRSVAFNKNETDNAELHKCYGAFVSIYCKNELRGCIGTFSSNVKLYEAVIRMTEQASKHDYRFNPIKPDELNEVKIEISVLSPLKKIHSIDEFELGKHGIYIKKGFNSGTFLPQVANKTSWNKEEFIAHCSNDKAGIGWDGWREAELYTYEVFIIKE
jgi:hypothetical protein